MRVTHTIAELAREFGITTRTIRHYEEQGLLQPVRQGTSRVFSSRDRSRLQLALRSKRLGFSLQEIKELFHLYDKAWNEPDQAHAFLETLEKRRTVLERQRKELESMLGEVDFFAVQCERRMNRRPPRAADPG